MVNIKTRLPCFTARRLIAHLCEVFKKKRLQWNKAHGFDTYGFSGSQTLPKRLALQLRFSSWVGVPNTLLFSFSTQYINNWWPLDTLIAKVFKKLTGLHSISQDQLLCVMDYYGTRGEVEQCFRATCIYLSGKDNEWWLMAILPLGVQLERSSILAHLFSIVHKWPPLLPSRGHTAHAWGMWPSCHTR